MADDQAEKIELFCSLTNAPRHVADHYLGAHDWDLDRSISYYFDNPPNSEPGPASPTGERADAAEAPLPAANPQGLADPATHAVGMDEDEEFQLALAASLAENGGGEDPGVPVSHPTSIEVMDEDDEPVRVGRRPQIPPSIYPDSFPSVFPAQPEPLIPGQTNARRHSSQGEGRSEAAVQGRGTRSRPSARAAAPSAPPTRPGRPHTRPSPARRSRVIYDEDSDDPEDDVRMHAEPLGPSRFRPGDTDMAAAEAVGQAGSLDLPQGIDLEEARMLEAAMLGIPYEGAALQRSLAAASNSAPISPGAQARQQLRYEQDEAYEMSLAADRAKEEAAEKARREVVEAERKEQEAAQMAEEAKQEEERQLQKSLSMKQLRLPDEPDADDESAIMIMVRVPDGTRPSRRFSKHDPLHAVFDFIDLHYQGQTVKPGGYRLVTQFPRKVFTSDSTGTFVDAGLTSRQEALFLEQS